MLPAKRCGGTAGRGAVRDPRSGWRGAQRPGDAQPFGAAPCRAQSDALAVGTNRFANQHRFVDAAGPARVRGRPRRDRVAFAGVRGGNTGSKGMKSEILEEVQRQASTRLLRALILEDSDADFELT